MNFKEGVTEVANRLWVKQAPLQWAKAEPPVLNFNATTSDEFTTNLKAYLTGFPWIAIVGDKANYPSYYCCLCSRVATPVHLLQSHHNRNAATEHYFTLVPEWMHKFQAPATTGWHGELWPDYTETLYPEVTAEAAPAPQGRCEQCNRPFDRPRLPGMPQMRSRTNCTLQCRRQRRQ